MKFAYSSIAFTLATLLTACGGGSDGYYKNESNNSSQPNTGGSTSSEDAQKTFNILKAEAASLFGQSTTESNKGYVDHAIDAYAQSVLKISQDIRTTNFATYKDTNRKEKCFEESKTDNRACYVFKGNEINKLLGEKYNAWDFVIDDGLEDENDQVTGDDLKNIRLKSDDITPALESYYGSTYLIVFENENSDKDLQDISIAGSFSFPFIVNGKTQKRFILINNETSDFKISVTKFGETTSTDMGALSIYKVPNQAGEYYVTEAGSGFSTLVNDNLNVSFAEPVTFRIDSALGVAPSIYKIKDGIETLDLPSIAITGSRVEHELPSLNDKEFVGSIFVQGPNIFNFMNTPIDSILKFKHTINQTVYEGESKKLSNGVSTVFKQPSSIKY
jgi:hypothetical protein